MNSNYNLVPCRTFIWLESTYLANVAGALHKHHRLSFGVSVNLVRGVG